MILSQILLALVSGASLATARPSPLDWNTPRASAFDWNVARNTSSFLRKRDVGRSPEEWNARAGPAESTRKRSPADAGEAAFHSFVAEKRAQAGKWDDMGGEVNGYPYAVSWGGYNLGVFYWDKQNKCQYKTWGNQAYQWGDWQNLGGYLDSPPAVCAYKDNYMDVYVKGDDDYVWYKPYKNGWGGWENIGGDAVYEPSTCYYGNDRVDVYVSSKEGECYHKYKTPSGWYSWQNLGGYLDGPPKVITYEKYMYVFVKGVDEQLWSRYYDGNGWTGWKSLGGYLNSYASAYYYKKKIYVYVKGTDKKCWGKTYYQDEDRWGDWEDYGGELEYTPDVVVYDDQYGKEKKELYITQEDKGMYRKTWENDRWSDGWEKMGNNVDSKPSPVSWDNGKVDIYVAGDKDTCRRCYG